MAEASDRQIAALKPTDSGQLAKFKDVLGTALQVMMHDRLPAKSEVETRVVGPKLEKDGLSWRKFVLSRKGEGEQVPAVGVWGPDFDGTVIVWVHPDGKSSLIQNGQLVPAAREAIQRKAAILALDVFGTGEFGAAWQPRVEANFAGYTFGYNRPLLANRVHDILTAIAMAKGREETKKIHLVGFGKAGPWVALARGLCGDAVARTAVDFDQFRFERVRTTTDDMMLPGAIKYGGLPALAAVAAPGELFVHNAASDPNDWLAAAYRASGHPDRLHRESGRAGAEKAVQWLLR
jgi:hypothetical protein